MAVVNDRRLAVEANFVTSMSTIRRGINSSRGGLGHPLKGMRSEGLVPCDASVRDVFAAALNWMFSNYRTETLYKNAIANQLLVRRHGLVGAALLSEMKVGNSVADSIIVNAHGTVYEIKTELDHPSKLIKQLRDYQTSFKTVFVVTHHSLAAGYIDMLSGEPVGVIAMGRSGKLRTCKRATVHTSRLSIDAMIKTLRRAEYTRIAEAIAGEKIELPATQHFRHCLEVSRTISPVDYCRLLEGELRKRQARAASSLESDHYGYIRHQLLKVDPTEEQLVRLGEWMSGRA